MAINLKAARFLRAITRGKDAPEPARPCVVFAGRSNVGKSSLFNNIVSQKGLARTSSTPGRTQEIVYFDVDDKCHFVDLPGYGYAKVPEKIRKRWGPMIERFLEENDWIRLVIVILDVRRDPSEQDLQMAEWLASLGRPHVFAVTKTDKMKSGELPVRLREIQKALGLPDQSSLLPFSAVTGAGRLDLIRTILRALDEKDPA